MIPDKEKEFLEKLKKSTDWPSEYVFKFIVPNDLQKLARVEALFDDTAVVRRKESRNGNFISVTGKELMLTPENVVEKYKLAYQIEGIISL